MARLQVLIGLLAAVLVFVTGGSEVARADPDVVQAGHDLLETAGETYMDFSANPLPADFFGPGSDPFDGVIALEGVPFDSFGGYNGLWPTDTIIRRNEDAGIPGFPDTIEIEMVALELRSVAPITVSLNGGMEFYDYDVTVSVPEGDPEQEPGSMTIRHEGAEGGTFDIEALPVRPLLTFTPLTGPWGTVGPLYWPEPPDLSLLVFEAYDEPWCHTANPLDVPPDQVVIEMPGLTTNFFPGIDCGPPRTKNLVVLDALFPARHSVQAAEKYPAVGGIATLPDVSDSSGRNYVALAGAAAAAAAVVLAASGWYARRRLS